MTGAAAPPARHHHPVGGASGGGHAPPILELRGIAKRFGDCVALDGVDLVVEAGTIHGLIGENGAGKSTLMRGVYGLDPPDAGTMAVDGRPITIRRPREALAAGIGMVHQHFQLVPGLSVLDNIILGAEPHRGPWIDREAARRRLNATAAPVLAGIDAGTRVDTLSVAGQQRVEIAKLLYRDCRLLILDEPTAVLPPPDAARLFDELLRLKGEGRTILLITHRLADVLGHTDAVTILRRGRNVAQRRTSETNYDELAGMLVATGGPEEGRGAPVRSGGSAASARQEASPGPILLELRHVSLPASEHGAPLTDVSLSVKGGEIVALVGVDGSGPGEVIRIAAGRLRPASGEVTRPAAGGWIPENRFEEAIVPSMTAAENLLLGRQRDARFGGKGWIDYARVTAHAARLLEDYDVRPAEPGRAVDTLSGGNQQKLVLARETADRPSLLVAAHPARGLDLSATRRVHDELRAARERGAAVLLMSSELDEVRAVADRIVVFFAGRIHGELTAAQASDDALGRLMTGGRLTESVA